MCGDFTKKKYSAKDIRDVQTSCPHRLYNSLDNWIFEVLLTLLSDGGLVCGIDECEEIAGFHIPNRQNPMKRANYTDEMNVTWGRTSRLVKRNISLVARARVDVAMVLSKV